MAAYDKNTPGPPVGHYLRDDVVTDVDGTVWVCIVSGNPATFDAQSAAFAAGSTAFAYIDCDAGTEDDTVTVGDQTWTLKDIPDPEEPFEVLVESDAGDQRDTLAAAILATPGYADFPYTAAAEDNDISPLRVVFTAKVSGHAGEEIVISAVGASFVEVSGLGHFISGRDAGPEAQDVAYSTTISPFGISKTVQGAIDETKEQVAVQGDAAGITFDHTISGLTATDVKAAIDELKALIDAL